MEPPIANHRGKQELLRSIYPQQESRINSQHRLSSHHQFENRQENRPLTSHGNRNYGNMEDIHPIIKGQFSPPLNRNPNINDENQPMVHDTNSNIKSHITDTNASFNTTCEADNIVGRLRSSHEKYSAVDKSNNELLSELQNKDAEIRQLISKLEEKKEEIGQLKAKLEESEGEKENLKSVLTNTNNEINELELKCKENDDKIKDLSYEDNNKQSIIKDLMSKCQILNDSLQRFQEEHNNFHNFLNKVSLFDENIGDTITLQYKEDKSIVNITERFKKMNPSIKAFHTLDIQNTIQRLESDNEKLKIIADNSKNLDIQMKQHFETFLSTLEKKSKYQSESLDNIKQEIMNDINQKLLSESQSIDNIKVDMVDDINQKLTSQSKSFDNIKETMIADMNQKFTELKLELDKKTELENQLSIEQDKNNDLLQEIQSIKGDITDKMTFENLQYPKVSKQKYQSLNLDHVEDLPLFSLQNIVKRTALELDLRADTLEANLPRVNIIIDEFTVLIKFICWLTETFTHEKLECHMLLNQANDYYLRTGDKEKALQPFEDAIEKVQEILSIVSENSGGRF